MAGKVARFSVLLALLVALTGFTAKTWNNTSYQIPDAGDRNWASLATFLRALADNAQTVTAQKVGVRVATTTPVTVSGTTDYCVITTLAAPGAVAVTLPAGSTGKVFTIIDGTGDAASNNITITPTAGLINGAATYVLNVNRGGVAVLYNGTGWTVISEFVASSSGTGTIARNKIAAGTADHVVINSGAGALSSEATLAKTRGGAGADMSSVTFPSTGTIVTEAGTQTLTNKTLTSPVLTTPTLGVASATTINKVTLTAPASGSTLTIAEGKTLTASNTLTFSGTDTSSVAFGAGGTAAYTGNKLSVFAATTSAELAGVLSDETGSGALVFGTTPTLTTPVLGVATATSINKVALTAPASSATLTIADGKTLTASNTLTFTGTDSSSVAFGAGGTAAYTGNKLSAFAATTSAELAGVLSDESGTGLAAYTTSPVLTTPTVRTSLTLQNASGAMPTLLLSEDPDNGTDAVTIQADDSFTGYTLTLPVDDGTANQVLSTDGSGVLSWASGLSSSLNQYNVSIGDSSNTAASTNSNLLGHIKATTGSFTFEDADVAAVGDTITETAHGLVTTDTVYLTNSGGALPTGLSASTRYFVIRDDANTIRLATTLAAAVAGTASDDINITAAAGGGTHTLSYGGFGFTGSTTRIPGTHTNDDAAPGYVGEYIESLVPTASSVSLTTATSTTITSISLTAGDWDVGGALVYLRGASTNITAQGVAISKTTNSVPSVFGQPVDGEIYLPQSYAASVPGASSYTLPVPPYRVTVSATTTLYLVARSSFTVSTQNAYGSIWARRAR